MRKREWGVLFLLVCLLVGLAGCTENTVKEGVTEEEKESREMEQQKDKVKNTTKSEQGNQDGKADKVEQEKRPVAVTIVDPNTKSVIKTIIPEELGFGMENEKYKIEIEKWVKELARGTDSVPGYDQRNTPDRLDANGQVIKGTPRVVLEEAELVEKVLAASKKGGSVELPLYIIASGYLQEDVAHLGEVVIASYTTNFNRGVAGRTKNIELSAMAINNVIVGINDYFAFNTTVGPSDEAHGYQPAEEALNGKLIMGIGGGICQTSSTLFNAVDQLAIEYVEWHHHSVTVGYVPTGRDATVSFGGKDFRFQNTSGVPFLLKTIIGNGTLTVEVRTSKQYEGVLKQKI